MGKFEQTQLPAQHQDPSNEPSRSSFCSRIFNQFSFKCVFVLILSLGVLISTLLWIVPHRSKHLGFDADSWIKKSAIVQAYFELEKPVSELIPEIARLEYDINAEIGAQNAKVAVLSLHQTGGSNRTDVMFGYLPDPVNTPPDPVSLAIIQLGLIEVYLQQTNLTLTNSSFGHASSFEILKFPGGISLVPKQPSWPNGQNFFNFTLNNSMSEVNENIVQLIAQLKLGLHLMPDENVYVQLLTNKNGSTRDPPITVEASITSSSGSLSPERLKQLAQNISRSPPEKILGLNNTVFGRVKEVSLSSYLNHTIDTSAPSSSPAPSPMQNDYPGPSRSPYASISPSYSPSPSTSFPYPPDGKFPPSPESEPPLLGSPAPTSSHCGNELPPSLSPAPRAPDLPTPASSPPPAYSLTSHISPSPSPLPALSHGSDKRHESSEVLPLTSMAPSQLFFHKKMWWFCFIGYVAAHLAWLDLLM